MDSVYDSVIDMLCLTGKIPLNMLDSVCEYAHSMITTSLQVADGDRQSRKERRNHELFGDILSFKNDYRSAWFDYECEYAYNFSMD